MLGANSTQLQLVGHLLQAALQILARLHQILNVEYVGEVDVQQFEKVSFVGGQVLVGEELQEVTKIVAGMEAQPLDVVHQYDAGAHQQFGELNGIDAVFFVFLKLNARILQQIDGVLCIHVLAADGKTESNVHRGLKTDTTSSY